MGEEVLDGLNDENCDGFDGYWVSEEQRIEHEEGAAADPMIRKSTNENFVYRVSVDRARRSVWINAKREYHT